MQLSHKFRLYPNKAQQAKLLETLKLCRWTYNHFLSLWQAKIPSRYELQAQIPKLKAANAELSDVYSKVL